MASTSVTASPLIAPEDIGTLVLDPLTQAAVCTQPGVTTVVRTNRSAYRLPVLRADGQVSFTSEGAEIPLSSATFDEVIVIPRAIKGLDALTSELLSAQERWNGVLSGAEVHTDLARHLVAYAARERRLQPPSGEAWVRREVSGWCLAPEVWVVVLAARSSTSS